MKVLKKGIARPLSQKPRPRSFWISHHSISFPCMSRIRRFTGGQYQIPPFCKWWAKKIMVGKCWNFERKTQYFMVDGIKSGRFHVSNGDIFSKFFLLERFPLFWGDWTSTNHKIMRGSPKIWENSILMSRFWDWFSLICNTKKHHWWLILCSLKLETSQKIC